MGCEVDLNLNGCNGIWKLCRVLAGFPGIWWWMMIFYPLVFVVTRTGVCFACSFETDGERIWIAIQQRSGLNHETSVVFTSNGQRCGEPIGEEYFKNSIDVFRFDIYTTHWWLICLFCLCRAFGVGSWRQEGDGLTDLWTSLKTGIYDWPLPYRRWFRHGLKPVQMPEPSRTHVPQFVGKQAHTCPHPFAKQSCTEVSMCMMTVKIGVQQDQVG